MDKNVQLQYKAETGNKPTLESIEMEMLKPEFKGRLQPGILMKDIPKYFIEKCMNDKYSLLLPDVEYIEWLENKVIELQQLLHNLKLEI